MFNVLTICCTIIFKSCGSRNLWLIMNFDESSKHRPDKDNFLNGHILSGIYVPVEVLCCIISILNFEEFQNCRLVCKLWRTVIDSMVCCDKLERKLKNSGHEIFAAPSEQIDYEKIPFYVHNAISQNGFGMNLLKNAFGSEDCPKFKHWEVISSGGDGWVVEQTPNGSDPLPEELEERSCFATSYHICRKRQFIRLAYYGLTSKIMDDIKPHIEISEWYAARFDCGCTYRLKVKLLDSEKECIQDFEEHITVNQWEGHEWHKISHTFKDYKQGVRYIVFDHAGKDTQFWAGHYGMKMAGASVIAKIPPTLFQ